MCYSAQVLADYKKCVTMFGAEMSIPTIGRPLEAAGVCRGGSAAAISDALSRHLPPADRPDCSAAGGEFAQHCRWR